MIELAELRAWLKIPPLDVDAANDALLVTLEIEAVALVETATGYRYTVDAAALEILRGTGTDEMILAGNPSADPTEILEVPNPGDAGTEITAAQADGWLRRNNRLLRKAGSVWTFGYEYAVTYPAGYAAGDEPPEVRNAVKRIVAVLYRQRGTEGNTSESIGGYSYTKNNEAIKDILATLFYRPVFA